MTGDPDEFTRSRFKLRQAQNGRDTELAIFLTMYNEDEALFCQTMSSCIKNIQYLQSRTKSKTWGANAWKSEFEKNEIIEKCETDIFLKFCRGSCLCSF